VIGPIPRSISSLNRCQIYPDGGGEMEKDFFFFFFCKNIYFKNFNFFIKKLIRWPCHQCDDVAICAKYQLLIDPRVCLLSQLTVN
jgi:hypothetical protein